MINLNKGEIHLYLVKNYGDSLVASSSILKKYTKDQQILKTKNGKPYLKNHELFFNIAHTKGTLLLAISQEEIGCDIEWQYRPISPLIIKKISKRFFPENNIQNSTEFLRFWCQRESIIKYLGSTIFSPIPTTISLFKQTFTWQEYICAITSKEKAKLCLISSHSGII